jgi:hypothetical protein
MWTPILPAPVRSFPGCYGRSQLTVDDLALRRPVLGGHFSQDGRQDEGSENGHPEAEEETKQDE